MNKIPEATCNPEVFIIQKDIPGLIDVVEKFAAQFGTSLQRRKILELAGIDTQFLNSLSFHETPMMFAHLFVAEAMKFIVSERRLQCHPFISFCNYSGYFFI